MDKIVVVSRNIKFFESILNYIKYVYSPTSIIGEVRWYGDILPIIKFAIFHVRINHQKSPLHARDLEHQSSGIKIIIRIFWFMRLLFVSLNL